MTNESGEQPPLSPTGMGYALSSYTLWGVAPVYWKWVNTIPAIEVLIPRVAWTLLLLILLARLMGRHKETWATDLRGWVWTWVAALLLGCNWGTFIYAVHSDQIVSASLGYYLHPLVSVVLGLVVLGERLNRLQGLAVGIALLGVAAIAHHAGGLPWISLTLGGSFALYGLIHKLAPRPAFAGLTREMWTLLPLALLGMGWLLTNQGPAHGLVDATLETHLRLALSGVVTAGPLLCFHAATRRLPLIAVGMFQYLAPTIALLLALFVYGETFTPLHAFGFGCVWLALGVFTLDAVRSARTRMQVA